MVDVHTIVSEAGASGISLPKLKNTSKLDDAALKPIYGCPDTIISKAGASSVSLAILATISKLHRSGFNDSEFTNPKAYRRRRQSVKAWIRSNERLGV
jgi:hypothetical protein